MELKNRRTMNRDGLIHGLYGLGILTFLLVFFLSYRPLIIDNFDDWTYISFTRSALPSAKLWNPAKVLPEILLPACVQAALWLVYPLTGDYIGSISLVLGVVLSLLILLYVYQFDRLLVERMKLPMSVTVLISALFFVFHFKAYMSPWIPSQHMFASLDTNNCFNYTVPSLINLSLVLWLERLRGREKGLTQMSVVGQGFVLLILYLAIFSNLYANCILAVYAGALLLAGILRWAARKETFARMIGEQRCSLVILGMWCVCALFELFGGRADWTDGGASLFSSFKETVSLLLVQIERMDDAVFYMCMGLIVSALAALAFSRGREKEDRVFAECTLLYLFCGAVTLLYQMLLSSVVLPSYIQRVDVLFPAVAYVFFAAFFSCAYLICKCRRLAVILPLIVFVMGFEVLLGVNSFAYCYTSGLSPEDTFAVNRAFIAQILEADAQGSKEMTLIVPKMNEGNNFPYSYTLGGRMHDSLSSQGVIKHLETIHIQPDEAFYSIYLER